MTRHDGIVVRLDRGFPLIRLTSGEEVRCEHATALVKGARERAVIGDRVVVELPPTHDKGVIESILPRATSFVRRDPAERTSKQVLAANFDTVIVVEPMVDLNRRRLERELVLAHETGARVMIVLSKADLLSDEERQCVAGEVRALAGRDVSVVESGLGDSAGVEAVRQCIPPGSIAILIGKSGVGKSTLVNNLAGEGLQETAGVRAADGKGRHTTVERILIDVPGGGMIADMPGVRGLGLWDAEQGLARSFPDVESLASRCRFRDCSHTDEPHCAVLAAVENGELAAERLESYRNLTAELTAMEDRREAARRLRGEKASDTRKRTGGASGTGRDGRGKPGGHGARQAR